MQAEQAYITQHADEGPAVNVAGATALVTGASGGLGRAIADALHDRGAQVIVTGRRIDALQEIAAACGGARVEVCDLGDADAVLQLASRCEEVDLVVANAALPAVGELNAFTPAEVERALSVNLLAPMLLTQRLLPAMAARGRGHFVYVSSIGGKIPARQLSVYSATKYGLQGFAGSLRQDLAGTGVSASVIFPGSVVDAGMLTDAGIGPPPGIRGVNAAQVAAAVIDAVHRNRGEIDVAPLLLRAVTKVVAVFPAVLDKTARRQDTRDYADQLSAALGHIR